MLKLKKKSKGVIHTKFRRVVPSGEGGPEGGSKGERCVLWPGADRWASTERLLLSPGKPFLLEKLFSTYCAFLHTVGNDLSSFSTSLDCP